MQLWASNFPAGEGLYEMTADVQQDMGLPERCHHRYPHEIRARTKICARACVDPKIAVCRWTCWACWMPFHSTITQDPARPAGAAVFGFLTSKHWWRQAVLTQICINGLAIFCHTPILSSLRPLSPHTPDADQDKRFPGEFLRRNLPSRYLFNCAKKMNFLFLNHWLWLVLHISSFKIKMPLSAWGVLISYSG